MKKIHFALCSILLLASCAGGEAADEGKAYIASFKSAYDASYSSGSYYVKTTSNGMKLATGIRNLNDTYYHLTGSGLTFEAGVSGVKASSADDLKAELLLQGGSLKLETDSKKIPSSLNTFLTLSPVKAKSYFDGGALYFNASGENRGEDTNSTIGMLAQALIREISGDSSYQLMGGSVLEGGKRYKGKWTLSDEDKGKITEKMPFVKEGDTLSEYFSLSSFIEGAYEDPNGKAAFSFTTKDDGTKRITFESKDKTVLSAAMSAGFATFSLTLDTSSSLPTSSEVKEAVDKFFTYAEPKTFRVEAFFTDAGLSQVSYDVNFDLDSSKIKEAHPEGMLDLSGKFSDAEDPNDYKFNLDSSLQFSGTLLTSFGDKANFSLPDLSDYLEFPAITKKSGDEE